MAEPSANATLTVNGLSFKAVYSGNASYQATISACEAISTSQYPTVLNTIPQDGTLLTASPANLIVMFNKNVRNGNPADAHSADNPANYLLVRPGTNGVFDTAACGPLGVGGLKADDLQVTINSISYDPATFIATLSVNNGVALPDGLYRLFICGTTSITDPTGTTFLNNHLSDSYVSFYISTPGTTTRGRRGANLTKLPDTGFAPNQTTLLPVQPAAKLYTNEGMSLEIPLLNMEQPIVGIPQSSNWDVTWLGNQIGYLQGTAFPTWNGNSVLMGHVTDANGKPGPFAKLGNLAWGDQLIILAWGQAYTYEVRSVNLWVEPSSTSLLTKHEELPWLTLITCHGYNEKTNTYRWRTAVRAVLVSIK